MYLSARSASAIRHKSCSDCSNLETELRREAWFWQGHGRPLDKAVTARDTGRFDPALRVPPRTRAPRAVARLLGCARGSCLDGCRGPRTRDGAFSLVCGVLPHRQQRASCGMWCTRVRVEVPLAAPPAALLRCRSSASCCVGSAAARETRERAQGGSHTVMCTHSIDGEYEL